AEGVGRQARPGVVPRGSPGVPGAQPAAAGFGPGHLARDAQRRLGGRGRGPELLTSPGVIVPDHSDHSVVLRTGADLADSAGNRVVSWVRSVDLGVGRARFWVRSAPDPDFRSRLGGGGPASARRTGPTTTGT